MGVKWYENPAWWALGFACLAFLMSLLNFWFIRRAKRADITQALISAAMGINEALARYEIAGPYTHYLKIPPEQVPAFTKKQTVFLNHINLLRQIYEHRDILGKDTELAYLKWVTTIVRPWVDADQDLTKVWMLLRESEDLVGKGFLEWLSPHLPTVSL